ncbi:MAG: TIGR04086 family membrane protein, partial [Oscillospiraceae bacterium]|nr:TIGR04086 family membrane protein [Oscillospiraceae bacterium]
MRVNEEEQGVRLVRFVGSAVLGGLLAAGVALMALFFCSLGVSAGLLSEDYMVQYAFAGCVLGGFAGGLFAALRCRAKTLLVGLG